jgi:putative phage-type endonuclease
MNNRLEWLQERQKGIGGSDIAAILGKSRFKTKLEVYYEKIIPITQIPEPIPALLKGMEAEPYILNEYEKLKAVVLKRNLSTFRHRTNPLLYANLDALAEFGEKKVIVDAKLSTIWGHNPEDWEYNNMPIDYLLQLAHYCNVLDEEQADLIVRFEHNWKYKIYTYHRDRELEKTIEDAATTFWKKYVEQRKEPEITANDYQTALRHYDKSTVSKVISEDMYQKYMRLLELQKQAASLEEEITLQKTAILSYCKEHDIRKLTDANNKSLISIIKCSGRESIDTKKLQLQFPEIYAQVTKTTNGYNIMRIT